ncbi:MAG: mechanosensitive ion channel family protein [Candidatus Riflebacteria bacterium]|nr:mechanosensitive ion channel family protein [Candidatus Riflebacteria bacterium]
MKRIPVTQTIFTLLLTTIFAFSCFSLLNPLAAQEAAKSGTARNYLESPKSTLRMFMREMNNVVHFKHLTIDKALEALHLDSVPEAAKQAKGQEMALQLYNLLDYYTFKIEALPGKGEITKNTLTLPLGEDENIKITLRAYSQDKWQFSYEGTLERLDEYVAIIEKKKESRQKSTTADPLLYSPRNAVRLFFNQVNQNTKESFLKASKIINVSDYDRPIRTEMALGAVNMLNFVFSKYRYIDLTEVSDDPDSPPVVLLDNPEGQIVLEKVKNPETELYSWKFSSQTVKDLPALCDAYEGKATIEDAVSTVEMPYSRRVRNYVRQNFSFLLKESFFLENWQWIGIFIIILLGLIAGHFSVYILKKFIALFFERKNVELIEATQKRFLLPVHVSVVALIAWGGFYMLALPPAARSILVAGSKVIAVIAAIWAAYRLIDLIGDYLLGKALKTDNKFDHLLAPLMTKASKALVIIFGVLFVADMFDLQLNKVVAGLGLGGLAVALAAKETVSNLFGSLTILMDRPFQIGDYIEVGSTAGTVESVGIRSTRIRTLYDSVITMPNSILITSQIDNLSMRTYRRTKTSVTIQYSTAPEVVEAFLEGIKELIRLHPMTRKDYFMINMEDFKEHGLVILIYFYLAVPDRATELNERQRLLLDILRLAKKLGISFAVPAQTIYMGTGDRMPAYTDVDSSWKGFVAEGQAAANEVATIDSEYTVPSQQ